MPSASAEIKRVNALRYYYRHRAKLLREKDARRRAAGVPKRGRGMTPDERREYYRIRAERRRRANGVPKRVRITPEIREKRALARQEAVSARRAVRAQQRALRDAEARRAREAARSAVRSRVEFEKRAPADVRAAWRQAHANSIIRRKFPTMQSLDRHYATT